jgi:pyridoxal phosphate enzyme (YggS family)
MNYMDHKDLSAVGTSEARRAEISANVRQLLSAVEQETAAVGRELSSVRVLAATKTRDIGEICAVLDASAGFRAGISLIGENRVQELAVKVPLLREVCSAVDSSSSSEHSEFHERLELPEIHLIGQLQANKINKVLPFVDIIEAVDSLELAQKIGSRVVSSASAADSVGSTGVFLEVNVSGESSKSGCEPDEAVALAKEFAGIEGISLQGLMTVGAHVDDESVIRAGFRQLRSLRDEIRDSGVPGTENCVELSMGMSHDWRIAVQEGATILRIGTAIFGERDFK